MSHTTQDLNQAYRGITPLLVGLSVLSTSLIVCFLAPPRAEEVSCESKVGALAPHQRMLIGAEDSAAWCAENLLRADEVISYAQTLPTSAPYGEEQ